MAPPTVVGELVERFGSHWDGYHSAQYNEAQLREEFLNPLFEALGWDIYNRKGYADAYKEVIHEAAIKVGGRTKAPDYCFRVGGGVRSFFVEAKKPSVDIREAAGPAYQLRRYAWSAKLGVSVLTDFEEFAVYDCRIRPLATDRASTARIAYWKYTEYVDRWNELADLFSPEAIRRGSLDKFIASTRVKKGTAEVDAAFLGEIESWRDVLARHLAMRNPDLAQRNLNFAVQRTIDRLVFLRICEDRGIEPYGNLQAMANGPDVYRRLVEVFQRADDRYNSGLFHFSVEKDRSEPPDELTLGLAIDDKPLRDIIKNLYYPESPYEFSVFPAEILGQVYEQFLGKVIRLTGGHRAVVEHKPEVKKAGGVYYTPSYIVDYIVRQTVGRLLEGKRPAQAAEVKVLDPACGSGSFLIGAYQYLLDWHRDWYVADGPERHARARNPRLYRGRSGDWRLTTAERKRILLNSIYGVDIDPQAVEVTKLSLLLKVLEGESQETLANQLRLFHQRALPDLGNNVKCGNSLIAPDFYDDRQMSLFDEEAIYRINAFDWKKEFAPILHRKNCGFDSVIGNPPWGGDIDRELEYYHAHYPRSTQDHTDSFKLFLDRATSLAAVSGLTAMIVPSTILRQRRLKDVRTILLERMILRLVELGEDVFSGVVAPSCILVVQNGRPLAAHRADVLDLVRLPDEQRVQRLQDPEGHYAPVEQRSFERNPDLEFSLNVRFRNVPTVILGSFERLQCKDAGINYQRLRVGMQAKGKSDLAHRLLYEGPKESRHHKMYWKGSDMGRYWIRSRTQRFCRPDYHAFVKRNEVVRLASRVYDLTPKILFRQTADHLIATIDMTGVWFGRSIIAIVPNGLEPYRLEYFLGLLNSRYFVWLYHNLVHERGRVFAQVKLSKIKQLPLRTIDFAEKPQKVQHNRMVGLVEQMLHLHQSVERMIASHEKTVLERQIQATDRQIDDLVYELYGLTDEEIAIVEKATG